MNIKDENFDLNGYVTHHVADGQEWALPFIGYVPIPEQLSLHAVMLFIAGFLLFLLFGVLYNKKQKVPHGLTNALETLVLFVRNEICIACIGEKDGKRLAPFFCTFFFFILMMNVMGLIPLFSTATANINVTAGLACVTLSFMIFGTIYRNGLKGFVQALIPSGVPIPVLFIIVPLELFGMILKSFALTMRLFANMMAGHIIIFSLLGVVVLFGYAGLPAVILAVAIYFLEIFVAFLQAYIFTFLSAIFIGQMLHPDH